MWATWWRCWSWVRLLCEGSKGSGPLSQLCSPALFDLVLQQFLLFPAGCWMRVASSPIVHCTSRLAVAVRGWDHRHKPCLFYRWHQGMELSCLASPCWPPAHINKTHCSVCRESLEQAFCNGWIQGRSFYSYRGKLILSFCDFVRFPNFMELWDKLRIMSISKYYFLSFLSPYSFLLFLVFFPLCLTHMLKTTVIHSWKEQGCFILQYCESVWLVVFLPWFSGTGRPR